MKIKVMHYINRIMDNNHMIVSIDAEKSFDKTQYPFTVKTLNKIGTEGNFPNLIKCIYEKPTANIMHNSGRLRVFHLRSGTRQRYPFSLLLFNILLAVLARAIRQENEIKGIQTGNKEVKLSLLSDNMILYIEKPKEPTKILLELINEFSKFARYKRSRIFVH